MANTRALEAGKATIRGSLDDSAIERTLRKLQRKFAAFGAKLRSVGLRFSAVGAAITAPFIAAVKVFTDTGDALNKMSARTGVAVESLSALKFAFEQSGSDGETLEKAIRGMQRSILNLDDGLSTSVDTFNRLGLSMSDLQGLNPEEQFKLIASRIAAIEDPTERAAIAMRIFGKAGSSLLPVLGNVDALTAEARRLGIVMSTEDAQAAADFADAMNRLKQQLMAVVRQVGAAVAGPLTGFLRYTQAILRSVIDWVSENRRLFAIIAGVGAAIAAAGVALIGLGTAFSLAAVAIGGIISAISAVGAVIGAVLSPVGLLVAGIAAGTVAFFKFTEAGQRMATALGSYFGELWTIFSETFGAIKSALASGDTEAAANVMWAGLEVAWLTGTAKIREVVRNLYGWMLKVWTNSGSALRGAWHGVTQFFADAIDIAGAAIVKSWNNVVAFFEKTWLRIKGLLGQDVSGEIARINSELQSTNRAIDQDVTNRIGGRDAAYQEAERAAERERQRRLDEIDSQTDGALEAAKERQRAARSAWEAARDAANASVEAAASQVSAATSVAEAAMGVGGGGSRGGATSIFDSRFASQVFGGKDVQNEQLVVLKQVRDESKKTRQAVEDGGGIPVD